MYPQKQLPAIFLFISFSFFTQIAFAQNEVMNNVLTAFKSSNSKEVAKYFNNSMELIIEPENVEFDNVSNSQAELVLKNFFLKYPAKDFNWGHQGSSPDGSQYRTGTYDAANNKFVVFVVLKQNGGKYIIDKLYIQK